MPFRAVGTADQGNKTSLSVTIPAGAQIGDQLILPWVMNNSVSYTTLPAGWDLGVQDNGGSCLLVILKRTCQSGDPGSTVTLTPNSITRNVAQVIAYSDLTWVDATTSGSGTNTAADVATPTNTIATPAAEVSIAACRATLTGSPAMTPPSGVTERIDLTTGAFSGSALVAVGDNLTVVPSGTIGGRTWVINQNVVNVVGATIELAPSIEVKTTTGSLPLDLGAAGVGASIKATTGSAPLAVGLAATSTPVRVTSGTLPLSVALAGVTGATVRATTGSLPLQVNLTGSATSAEVSTTTGTLPLSAGLAAVATSVKATTATLPLSVALAGVSTATRSTDGAIGLSIGLVAEATAVRVATGALPITTGLTAESVAVASTAGEVGLHIGLEGEGRALEPPRKLVLTVIPRLRATTKATSARASITTQIRHVVEADL